METAGKIRVFIVDDSAITRMLLHELLAHDAEIEVIGEACNGRDAVERILILKPDIVTMDLEMPIMGGHEAIERIMAVYAVPILVVSSLDDTKNACAAISRGALDVIGKPQLDEFSMEQFTNKVKMLAKIKVIKHLSPSKETRTVVQSLPTTITSKKCHIIAIATSTGGPQALDVILQTLPADFPCPIVITQHISTGFEQGLADWLNSKSALNVKVAQDNEQLMAGSVYISPVEQPLSVTANQRVRLNKMDEKHIYHPSCNVLLESVAEFYGKKALGIICTGMGSDGVTGMEHIHASGGGTLAQDEASSVIFGMNHIAIEHQCIDRILPLQEISAAMLILSAYQTCR